MSAHKLSWYRGLPYTRNNEMVVEDDGRRYWVAWVEELPGCKTDGDTLPEAMKNLEDAFDDFIAAKLEWGSEIPLPERLAAAKGRPTKKRAASRRGKKVAQPPKTAVDVEWPDLDRIFSRAGVSTITRKQATPRRPGDPLPGAEDCGELTDPSVQTKSNREEFADA